MAVSAAALPTRTLRLEDKGAPVNAVERALVQLGYLRRDKYAGDGYFGTLTRDALRRFQTTRGLPATGIYDAGTRAVLAKAVTNPNNTPGAALKLEDRGSAVQKLETRLARLGLMQRDGYSKDGYFGTLTRDALSRLQSTNGLAQSGTFTPATRRLVRDLLTQKPTPPPPPSGPTAGEPAANYNRVHFRGATVNVRTQQMLLRAEKTLKEMGLNWQFQIVQGSYSTGVAASANTHAGGGAVDLSVRGPNGQYLPYATVARAVKALRMAGFAAWSRGYQDGTSFSPHIHGIAIGDKQLSSDARSQVSGYSNGRNGLADNGVDRDHSVGRPVPSWAKKYL